VLPRRASNQSNSPPSSAVGIIESLVAHKLDAVKGPGGVVAYEAASVRCRSFNEGDSGQPDACEVTAK
jgi:hypothetical protein